MSAVTNKPTLRALGDGADAGNFGLPTVRIGAKPEATAGELLNDAHWLIRNAMAVFAGIADRCEVEDEHFAGMFLLRQGEAALAAAMGANR